TLEFPCTEGLVRRKGSDHTRPAAGRGGLSAVSLAPRSAVSLVPQLEVSVAPRSEADAAAAAGVAAARMAAAVVAPPDGSARSGLAWRQHTHSFRARRC